MISCWGRFLLAGLAITLAVPAFCQGAVKGTCSTCHTMHNSEQGSPVAFSLDSSGQKVLQEQAYGNLLKTDCLGCHSSANADTIVGMGESLTPIVFNLAEPTYPPNGSATSTLAGGNFHWVFTSGDPYGHNVYGISPIDSRFPLDQAPGGEPQTGECVNCHATLATAQSGCEGCHVPMHHADNSTEMVVGKENGWFRFLGSVMLSGGPGSPPSEGVVGIEALDWEQGPLVDKHNTYQGKPGPFGSYLESGSIDQKCTGCHSQFHNETTANSTWIRHPVDVAIPDSGDFVGFTTYNPMVPVARQNVSSTDAGFSVVTRGSDLVSCISCHRAHGSPYPAMLRWGFRDWPGTDMHTQKPAMNGCAVCHTAKS